MAFWTKQEQADKEGAGAAPQQPTTRDTEEGSPMISTRSDAATTAPTTGDLLLGPGAEFEGKLTFAGTVRIDAKFKGSITTNDVLVVGEHAKLDAEITCGTVIVYGEVNGNIIAKTAVELHYPARLRGDVETPSFMVEKGVVFQGQTRMDSAEKGVPVKAVAPLASKNGDAKPLGSSTH